jgi:hypothetical protein
MKNINKVILMLVITSSFSIAQTDNPTIYSWRAENGNMVFSETKPSSDIDFKVVSVGKPTVIDTKAPQKSTDGKDVKIEQSDIEKLANSKLAEENKQALEEAQGSTYEVTITSPSESENKFTKEEEIAIITNPTISGSDKPIFMINGSSVPGKYKNGKWLIPRPNPGENNISVAGVTEDGKDIHSSNTATLRIFNGTVLQMKNTGNSKRAAR